MKPSQKHLTSNFEHLNFECLFLRKLFTLKIHPKLVTLGNFLRDLQPKQIFRETNRHTLKCLIATIIKMGPLIKQIFPTKKELWKLEQSWIINHAKFLSEYALKRRKKCRVDLYNFPSLKSVKNGILKKLIKS